MAIKQLRMPPMPEGEVVAPAQGEHYRMFIRDLVLPCRIGAYPQERQAPQRVRFNIDMRVQAPAGPIGDDLANVVSYDDVVQGVRRLAGGEHVNLVETLAERVAELCLADARVAEVRVRVEKLDVEPAAAGLGVEIERRRRTAHPAVAELFSWTAAADGARRRGGGG
ncbi:MAG: dihydroneopterin aldolase [Rhodospirillaceae bacterium]|nr:dihydroneopterin aldolase [Rhodospirillaceae bacterium]